ncbi:heterokaryon incompatibility protein-domain-containing protein [Xylariales sp. PMI_506]|nr:heterokaryon incompatibility protein-domain-containing protein [Xylariales sp. PMI_506]
MWLINTETLALEDHISCPKDQYVILSHTWGEDEVSFDDFKDLDSARQKGGFFKIEKTVKSAKKAGYKWAWVDTCCIDKRSSAELSEAINSMYQWYRDSAVCYAYLVGLPTKARLKSEHPEASSKEISALLAGHFGTCKWWKRGWTLQELVAPRSLKFYDEEWNYYGSKSKLTKEISSITNMSKSILRKEFEPRRYSIAARMSWASGRRTTRVEDTAYCLLGILGVNMTLLYGEGPKAFIRLQEELLRQSSDLSLFAWVAKPSPETGEGVRNYRGILAEHPSEFSECGAMLPTIFAQEDGQSEMNITNRGMRVDNWELEFTEKYGVMMRLGWLLKTRTKYWGIYISLAKIYGGWVRSNPDLLFVPKSKSEEYPNLVENRSIRQMERVENKHTTPSKIFIRTTVDSSDSQVLMRQHQAGFFFQFGPSVHVLAAYPECSWDAHRRALIVNDSYFAGAIIFRGVGEDAPSPPPPPISTPKRGEVCDNDNNNNNNNNNNDSSSNNRFGNSSSATKQPEFILLCGFCGDGSPGEGTTSLGKKFSYCLLGLEDKKFAATVALVQSTQITTRIAVGDVRKRLRLNHDRCWDVERRGYIAVGRPGPSGTATVQGRPFEIPSLPTSSYTSASSSTSSTLLLSSQPPPSQPSQPTYKAFKIRVTFQPSGGAGHGDGDGGGDSSSAEDSDQASNIAIGSEGGWDSENETTL